MYIIKINIETDGDFNFDNQDIECQLTDDFTEALMIAKERVTNIIKTINGSRDYIIDNVKKELSYIIEELNYVIESNHKEGNLCLSFDCGNQYGDIEIIHVKQEILDGVITYRIK